MRWALQLSVCLPRHGPRRISSISGSDSMRLKSWVKVQIDCLTGRWAIGGLLTSLRCSFIKLTARFFYLRPVHPNPIQKSLCRHEQALSELRQFIFNAWWNFGEEFTRNQSVAFQMA